MARTYGCKIEDCDSGNRTEGYSYCLRHYRRFKKYGNPLQKVGTDKRGGIEKDDHILLPLGIDAISGYAIIDKKDKELTKLNWCIDSSGYAMARSNRKKIRLHQAVIGKAEKGMCIDHINRNRLDNRRKNLRHVTYLQNARNSSPYGKTMAKGVTNRYGKWQAFIRHDDKRIHLGTFLTKEEAVKAREKAEERLWQ